MTICAVFVTYANRSGLCMRAAGAALAQGISRVIIVDNGSAKESADALRDFSLRQAPLVSIVTLPENTGSAKGFAAGIAAFLSSGADIIWLLDDDNLLATDACLKITEAWNRVPENEIARTALAAFRADRYNYAEALATGDGQKMLPPYNAYDGFHLKKISALLRRSSRDAHPDSTRESVDTLSIPAAAYGGLWMHRSLCGTASPPDANYLLYMDDFDYTWRIRTGGARILLLRDVVVTEIEQSYYLPEKKSWKYHSLLAARSDSLAYYTCRNVVYFTGRHLVTNRSIYRLNRLAFRLAITALALANGQRKRLGVILRAMRDGEAGRLGKNTAFPL